MLNFYSDCCNLKKEQMYCSSYYNYHAQVLQKTFLLLRDILPPPPFFFYIKQESEQHEAEQQAGDEKMSRSDRLLGQIR